MTTRESWLQAQYSVLGSVLIEPELVPKVVSAVRVTDFYGQCVTVYKAICKLFTAGSPVDVVTLAHELGKEYHGFLKELMEIVPSAKNIDSYISICREQSRVVTMRELGQQLMTAENSDDVRKVMQEANALLLDKSTVRIYSMEDALKSFYERHTGEVQYLNWPIAALNNYLYCEPGDFIILGGRPSSGKSAFALQCAKHWAKTMKVGFFSLETGQGKLFDRMVSSMTAIGMDNLKRNQISQQQWETITVLSNDILKKNLDLIPAAGVTVEDIRAITTMNRYDLILIDYVQFINGTGGNRTEEVSGISMALHQMAQSMGVTVVGLSQLRRADPKQNRSPEASDLRESGQLEQDADVILMLELENKDDYKGNRWLYIAKNKEGETPRTLLAFDGKYQTFRAAADASKRVLEHNETGRNMKKGDSFAVANQKAKQTVQKFCAAEAAAANNQMSLLPEDTEVPFKDG